MCVVSAVMDYGQKTWPDLLGPGNLPWAPNVPGHPLPPITIWPPGRRPSDASPFIVPLTPPPAPRLPTLEEINAFLKLYEEAQRFDAIAKQPHCEDAEKIKLLDQIAALKARLEALEERAARQDAAEDDANIAYAASVAR